jgi:3',5'-cyclic AMP phosphodiesterase CpdA
MEPIIDPRRGDFEDDASSPMRRSLVSLAGSLLVEISLPKLIFAWLIMLVIPSILLGLAPFVATAWLNTVKWKFEYALAELWPAVLLAAIVILGWFGGRHLFGMAKDSFWALNSLAVEPVYLTSRELLRYVAEKLLPAQATRSQYASMRAAAAAVASVLICIVAVFVLLLAWPHTRWMGTIEDLTSLHLMAPVALANSVVVVSAYLAVAALVWGIADATMTQPLTLEGFPSPPEHARQWRFAHLSDIHMVGETYGFRIECGRMGPRGNERFRQALARLDEIHAQQPLDAIVVTGDMTDAGRSAEWAEFLDAISPYPQLAQRMLVLPGNHDLSISDRANPARLELPTSPNRRLRQLRALTMMSALQGLRVHVVDFEKRVLGASLDEALKPHLAEITRFADTGRPLFSWKLAELWRDVFPLIVPPDSDGGLGIILLNSNADSQFSFTSALGMISGEQIRGIEVAKAQFPQAHWIIALHHHLVEYPRAGHALAERIGTALINGSWVVRRLKSLSGRAVVMHGHRHIDWIGECGGLFIISAPSPVMDSVADHSTCFYIHTLSAAANGRLTLAPPQRITVDGSRA